jgi:hypothetical protein
MLITVVLLYLALPSIVVTIYALLWPTVSSRVALFITLGSIFGVIVAFGTLFWMVEPLFGPPSSQPDTLWSLLGPRLLTGAIIEVAGVYLILLLLARLLRPH